MLWIYDQELHKHFRNSKHCKGGRTPCVGKAEGTEKEVTGLVWEFLLVYARISLNSNQAQGAQLSVRAVVQAAAQRGNLSWSRVWSEHFEVISFSKEIISFVCTCSGKWAHWRLVLRTFG